MVGRKCTAGVTAAARNTSLAVPLMSAKGLTYDVSDAVILCQSAPISASLGFSSVTHN